MMGKGVGSRLIRKEDDRYLRGRGQFVADIRLAGMKEVAFARSPVAHARIRGITDPGAHRGAVFTAEDMAEVKPISAVSGLPGFKVSDQPALAAGKVRQVGELVAMCLADSRAQAEDIAASVIARVSRSCRRSTTCSRGASRARRCCTSTGATTSSSRPSSRRATGRAVAAAPITVTRELRTARQCMAPIEGKGVVAFWDSRLEQLTVYSATQMPHIVRTGLSDCLGLEHGQVRVIAPDVGGGFGYKGILAPGGGLRLLARAALPASGALDRGSARAPGRQRQLPRASLPHHRRTPTATAGCSASSARRPSIRAPIRPTRSPPAWRPRRSRASCPGRTTSRPIAAAPSRSRPTSARSCPIAGWRAPASASRSS